MNLPPRVGDAAVGQERDGGVDAAQLGLRTHGCHRYPVRPDDADASVDLKQYSIFPGTMKEGTANWGIKWLPGGSLKSDPTAGVTTMLIFGHFCIRGVNS